MKKIHYLLITMLLAAACQNVGVKLDIVPYPNDVTVKSGHFDAAGATFHYDAEFDQPAKDAIEAFAGQLSLVSGFESKVKEGHGREGFVFAIDNTLPKEAYSLTVSKKAAYIKASSLNGVIYAIQTMKQMLPVEIYGKEAAAKVKWAMQCAAIEDAPRFGYRGLHLDVSRHFFDVDEVKRYLDIMEVHKLNTFHWHLTDDQGWRIEIKKYPKLTEIGSIRKGTCIKMEWENLDGIPYGGFYTQDQIREVVAYAATKGITVIPEIDLPGHMLAALTAYPELGCTGGPYDLWCRWGISDDVVCVGKESSIEFFEGVLEEVIDLFPSEYIHIGGDECPKVRWENCPHCQAKIKELGLTDDEKHTAEHYLQSYVTKRMEEFLNAHGRKLIGWDEILEGEVAENATIMSWRGASGGLQAARMGHDAIMTPNTYFYLDYYQTLDTEHEPFGIGGYLPVEKCYSFEPYVEGMTDKEKSHILGVQANLWTEYIATADHLYYMLLPRLAALCEVQWCQPENKNWDRFVDSADDFCAIYDAMGYNYAQHIFQVKGNVNPNWEKGCIEMELQTQGNAPIRYTLDGTEPTEDSPLYKGPIEIRETCTVKAKAYRNGSETNVFSQSFQGHKAMGKKTSINTEPHPSYHYNAPYNMTDGCRGRKSYACGEFTGWYAVPLDAVIEMGGETSYSSVTIGTFIRKGDYVFNPLDLTVSVSENGKEYTEVARSEYPVDGPDGPEGCVEYTVTFPETSAKYLHVTAKTIESLPEWHGGHGYKGFLFVDEIVVE